MLASTGQPVSGEHHALVYFKVGNFPKATKFSTAFLFPLLRHYQSTLCFDVTWSADRQRYKLSLDFLQKTYQNKRQQTTESHLLIEALIRDKTVNQQIVSIALTCSATLSAITNPACLNPVTSLSTESKRGCDLSAFGWQTPFVGYSQGAQVIF